METNEAPLHYVWGLVRAGDEGDSMFMLLEDAVRLSPPPE